MMTLISQLKAFDYDTPTYSSIHPSIFRLSHTSDPTVCALIINQPVSTVQIFSMALAKFITKYSMFVINTI